LKNWWKKDKKYFTPSARRTKQLFSGFQHFLAAENLKGIDAEFANYSFRNPSG